jgi:hypothetical protein
MQTNIPQYNERGYKTVMGFIMDETRKLKKTLNVDDDLDTVFKSNYKRLVVAGFNSFKSALQSPLK